MHVVCSWIGNTQAVAAEHYLQVTDEHFARAAKSEPEALQKAVQHRAEQGRRAYGPILGEKRKALPRKTMQPPAVTGGYRKWAREDSNLRPHPYQGCALAS
jgi:hypothetical protein